MIIQSLCYPILFIIKLDIVAIKNPIYELYTTRYITLYQEYKAKALDITSIGINKILVCFWRCFNSRYKKFFNQTYINGFINKFRPPSLSELTE